MGEKENEAGEGEEVSVYMSFKVVRGEKKIITKGKQKKL
jgi:hypothetical protein